METHTVPYFLYFCMWNKSELLKLGKKTVVLGILFTAGTQDNKRSSNLEVWSIGIYLIQIADFFSKNSFFFFTEVWRYDMSHVPATQIYDSSIYPSMCLLSISYPHTYQNSLTTLRILICRANRYQNSRMGEICVTQSVY